MGMKGTELILEARRDVKYRYICEKCGVTTEWFTSVLLAEEKYLAALTRFKVEMGYDPSITKEKKLNALKKLQNFTSVFTKVIDDPAGEYRFPGQHVLADVFNKTFSEGAACPKCKERQSWYPMDTTYPSVFKYIKIYVLSFMIFGNLFGLPLVFAYTSVYSMSLIYVIPLQIVLLSLGWFLGVVRGSYLIHKRKSTRELPDRRNIPEVVWGRATVKALGTDELDYNEI